MSPSSSSIVLFFDRLHLVSIFLRLLTLSDSPNLSYFCSVLIYLVNFSSYMFSTVLFFRLFSSILHFCFLLFPSTSVSSCFPPLLFPLVSLHFCFLLFPSPSLYSRLFPIFTTLFYSSSFLFLLLFTSLLFCRHTANFLLFKSME